MCSHAYTRCVLICTQCHEENPERARFCLACGAPIAEPAPPALVEERKLVTAVFVDLVGFTSRSEGLDPEDVRALQAPYHARLRTELERHGGTVEKYIGDAVFALFGAPTTHEDDPERAVRAALAIQRAIADLNATNPRFDLHIRIGINTGEALVGLTARPAEGEAMAAGDVVNTANRLESAAPKDGILVGEQTYRATSAVIEYEPAEPVQAKGKREPVPAWRVVGARELGRPSFASPLVGRERELADLEELWRDVVGTREPAIASVIAAPGIGKSRLLAELAHRLEPDATVLTGRCLPYGEGITYWPVVAIVRAAAGIAVSDEPDVVAEKLGSMLERLPTRDRHELRTIGAALAHLIGAPATPRGTYSAESITQRELHWGFRRLFELLAAHRPLVLAFEDLHWAEPTLLELLAFLGESQGAPILVLASARPELRELDATLVEPGPRRRVLELEPLDAGASEELLGALLGRRLTPSGARALLESSAGNPLFLEELVQSLEDEGPLGGAGTELDVETMPMPTSLRSLIASRLDRLPAGQKQAAAHASVIGMTFWTGAVGHLSGVDGEVDARLNGLARRDFVQSARTSSIAGEREWLFKHVLIRDVAYGGLPKRERARLHRRCAEWNTTLPGEEVRIELVAYHLEQACLVVGEIDYADVEAPVADAVQALSRAAEKAERREGLREAERFYTRALALAEPGSPTALELTLKHAQTLGMLGELERASQLLVEVECAAAEAGVDEVRCAALLALVSIDRKLGYGAASRRHLHAADQLACVSRDVRLRIRAAFERAQAAAWFDGIGEAELDDLREGLAMAEAIDDRALRIEAHQHLGTLFFNLGRLTEAAEHLESARALAAGLGSRRDEARAMYLLAFTRYHLGRLDEAEHLGLQAHEWLERSGDTNFQLQNGRALAKYALARGDAVAAEQRLREGLPLARERGGWLLVEFLRLLAEALVRENRLDEARAAATEARASLPEEDPYASAAALLSEIITDGGAAPVATRERAAEAFQLLQEQHLLLDLEEARLDVARALLRFGDPSGARSELTRARESLDRLDAAGLLAQINRELNETGGVGGTGSARPGPT
jgi:class 3 adenylate cyclase/tetratricopeptide (TPR) repeat protein